MSGDKIALIDLDGTLADYESAMLRGLQNIAAPGEHPSLSDSRPHMKARTNMIRSVPGFWKNLDVIPSGRFVLSLIIDAGFSPHILTKGPKNTIAWSEKFEWCRTHFPDIPVTITKNKGLVYGRVLFDDWPAYIDSWLKWRPRGLVIMPARSYNGGYSHPNVIRYEVDYSYEAGRSFTCDLNKEPNKSLIAALKKAFDRPSGSDVQD